MREPVKVSVVIPAYNEGEVISEVIKDVKQALEGTHHPFEIIVVDDHSDDETGTLAEMEGARVIRHPENLGSGASRKTGIRASSGEWIVMIDGDGTYPADAIPKLLDALDEYPQVIGARTVERGTYRLLRSLVKGLIRRLASFLVGRQIDDLNSGLRAFHRREMERFLYLIPDGFSCVSSMTLSFMSNGLPVKFIPIPYYRRVGKSKFHPVKDTYNYLLMVIRIVAYFNPLNVFMPLCLLFLGLAVTKGVVDLILTSTLQESDIILFLTGILLGALGILADLIVAQGRRDDLHER